MGKEWNNMNYIVFDLEWNQPEDGIPNHMRKLLFEIIEIGAVKLNEDFEIISSFHEMIRPKVYHRINATTWKMLKLTRRELNQGGFFPVVCKRFLEWCGPDAIFCTWGSQDLTELQRNMAFYNMKPLSTTSIKYLNIQKIFGIQRGEEDISRNLESAVDQLEIPKDIPFHRADSDAYYTAKIMKYLDLEQVKKSYSFDLFHLPSSAKDEIAYFANEELYILTKGYASREEILERRQNTKFICYKCGNRALRAKVRWFSTNSKILYGAALCEEHGAVKGRMKFRKDAKELVHMEKFLTYVPLEEIDKLRERKIASKKKKQG